MVMSRVCITLIIHVLCYAIFSAKNISTPELNRPGKAYDALNEWVLESCHLHVSLRDTVLTSKCKKICVIASKSIHFYDELQRL